MLPLFTVMLRSISTGCAFFPRPYCLHAFRTTTAGELSVISEQPAKCNNNQINIEGAVRSGADQSSKAAFCKSAFTRSRFAFRQSIFASQKAMVWPSATSKMLSAKTCQNVIESIYVFCQIGVRHVVSLTKESTFCQKQLCQIDPRPAK